MTLDTQSPIPGLLADEWLRLAKVFDQHSDISRVWLYGSRAKGSHRGGSDIDLALDGQDLDLVCLADIMVDIEELALPVPVDLVARERLPANSLRTNIESHGHVIWERKACTVP